MLYRARIVLVGCGHMGEALLTRWLAAGVAPQNIMVVEPDGARAAHLQAQHRIAVVDRALPQRPADVPADVVVLAVKPQVLDAVAPAYLPFADAAAVVLSIAAGRTIASLQRIFGREAALVRAMPNTPAAVGRGMTAAFATPNVSPAQHALIGALLTAVGEVAWVDEEGLIDAVTAVSGSGPAYVFYFVECLAAAGVAAGLPPPLATQLARATVTGAGELLFRATEPADELRRRVTSPGGTTAAALTALMADDGLAPLLAEAVRRAAARAGELAN